MTAVLACLGLVLALAALVYLINRSQGILEIPLMVGLLIGFAFAMVVGQIVIELTKPATPDLTKLIDTERQSRENDTKALGGRLDEVKTALSTLTTKVDKATTQLTDTIKPLPEQIKQLSEQIKPLPGQIANHEGKLKALESHPVPVTLASAQVRVQAPARGKLLTTQVVPQITMARGAKIQWAEISFCALPSDGGACVLAPPTKDCARNLCVGQDGQHGTVLQPVASRPQFCVQVKYALADNTEATLYGGPLTPTNGSAWHPDTASSSPCEPKSNHPGTPGA